MFPGNKPRVCCNANIEIKRKKDNYSPGSFIYIYYFIQVGDPYI